MLGNRGSRSGVLQWVVVLVVGILVVTVVLGLNLIPRLNAGQKVLDAAKPAFATPRLSGARAGINIISKDVDVADPIMTSKGAAVAEVPQLIAFVAQKTGLSQAAVVAALQKNFPHTTALLLTIPLSSVTSELPGLLAFLEKALHVSQAQLLTAMKASFPGLTQAITNLPTVTGGWNQIANIDGLTRFDGTPVQTVPQFRTYVSSDLIPVLETQQGNFDSLDGTSSVNWIAPLLLIVGLVVILFAALMIALNFRGQVSRRSATAGASVVLVVGLGVVALVLVLSLVPRVSNGQKLLDALRPVNVAARVHGDRAGINMVSAIVDTEDPIMTPQGGAAAEVPKLIAFVSQKTGLSQAAVVAALQKNFPHTTALLQTIPLSSVTAELPGLLTFLEKTLQVSQTQLLAALTANFPRLAQAITNLPTVTSGWDQIQNIDGLTRFDGSSVQTVPQFRTYVSSDLIPVLETQQGNFASLDGTSSVNWIAPLLLIVGLVVILFAALMIALNFRGQVSRRSATAGASVVLVVGLGVVALVLVLSLVPRVSNGQKLLDALRPVNVAARVHGDRAGINMVSAIVDTEDPIMTPQGGAAAEVPKLIAFVSQKTGLSQAAVVAALQKNFPHTTALLQTIPLSSVTAELPGLLAFLEKTLQVSQTQLLAALTANFPRLAQAITNLPTVTSGWDQIQNIDGLTRFDGSSVQTVPQFRTYVSSDLIPVLETQQGNFASLDGTSSVNWIPPLLLVVGLVVILFAALMIALNFRGQVSRGRATAGASVVLVVGLGVVALVLVLSLVPRVSNGQKLLDALRPVNVAARVHGDRAGINMVSAIVDTEDPIMTPQGGAAAEVPKLIAFVSQKTGLSQAAVVAALQKNFPHTTALLQTIPLSSVTAELPGLLAFLEKTLQVSQTQLLAALTANFPRLAQAITNLPTVTSGWDQIQNIDGLTRFDGTSVQTVPQLRTYVSSDLIPVLETQQGNFASLDGTSSVNWIAPLLLIVGLVVILFALRDDRAEPQGTGVARARDGGRVGRARRRCGGGGTRARPVARAAGQQRTEAARCAAPRQRRRTRARRPRRDQHGLRDRRHGGPDHDRRRAGPPPRCRS